MDSDKRGIRRELLLRFGRSHPGGWGVADPCPRSRTVPLVVLLAPIAIVQAIAGLRAYAGRLHYLWVAIPCALVGIALGNGMTGGIAAPIAWASVAVNIIGIGAALMAAVDARDAPLDQ